MFVVVSSTSVGGAVLFVVFTSNLFHRDIYINALKFQLTMSQVLIFLLLLSTTSRVLFFFFTHSPADLFNGTRRRKKCRFYCY